MRLLTSPARRSLAVGIALASLAVVLQFGIGMLAAFLGALPFLQGLGGEASFAVFVGLMLAAAAVVVRGAGPSSSSAHGAALLPSSFRWIATLARWSSIGLFVWLARSVAKSVVEAGLYTGHRHLSVGAAARRLVSYVLSSDGGVPLLAATLLLVMVDASARAVLRGESADLGRARLLARGTLAAGLATLAAFFVPLFRATPIPSIDAVGGYVAYYTALSPGVWETTACFHVASLVLIATSLLVLAAARVVEVRRGPHTLDRAAPTRAQQVSATVVARTVRVAAPSPSRETSPPSSERFARDAFRVAVPVDDDFADEDDLRDVAAHADGDRPRARRR